MFIIRNIHEQKYLADIKPVTVRPTADSSDMSDSVTRLASSMVKSLTPQMCLSIEEENIILYIGGYICHEVSRSVCDDCTINLIGNFDVNNKKV